MANSGDKGGGFIKGEKEMHAFGRRQSGFVAQALSNNMS